MGPQITQILQEWQSGNREALDRLVPIVYRELRAIASRRLGRGRGNGTLQTTAVVHEAYVRLIDQTRVDWQDRAHFFAVAARVMRRVVLDEARRRRRDKRGGGVTALAMDAADEAPGRDGPDIVDVIALDRALTKLEAMDAAQAQIVEFRFFAGLTVDEIGAVMKLSPRTVKREWAVARAWLYRALTGSASQTAEG